MLLFLLISENQETFELFLSGKWSTSFMERDGSTVVDKISNQLLPQAAEVARAVNENYVSKMCRNPVRYASV